MRHRERIRVLWQQLRSAQAILLHAYENQADAPSNVKADSLAAVVDAQRGEIRHFKTELTSAYGKDVFSDEGENN